MHQPLAYGALANQGDALVLIYIDHIAYFNKIDSYYLKDYRILYVLRALNCDSRIIQCVKEVIKVIKLIMNIHDYYD